MSAAKTNTERNPVGDIASRKRYAKFSVTQRVHQEEIAKRAGVEVLPYEFKRHPRGKVSRANAVLDALLLVLARLIAAALELDSLTEPCGSSSSRLLELCKLAEQIENKLKHIFALHSDWFYEVLRASIFISVDTSALEEPELKGQTAEEQERRIKAFERNVRSLINRQRGERITQARRLAEELLFKSLKLPSYESIGEPILPRHIINGHERSELLPLIKERATSKAVAIATAILQVVRNGLKAGLFFELKDLGQPAQSFSYLSHYVTDVVENASSVDDGDAIETAAQWRRTIKTMVVEQTLIFGKLYSHESMLANPSLEIPPSYRRVVEQCPTFLAHAVTGLFGTQTSESQSLRRISTTNLETQTVATLWRQRVLPRDPCLLIGNICFIGWGDSAMVSNEAHQQIVNAQRKLLDKASRQGGRVRAYLFSAAVTVLVLVLQTIVLASSDSLLLAVVVCLPQVFVVGAFLAFASLSAARMRLIRSHEEKKTKEELEELENLFPGFDATDPRLVDTEAKK